MQWSLCVIVPRYGVCEQGVLVCFGTYPSRLPCRSTASVCAFSVRYTRAEEDMSPDAASSGYKLSVATLQGILYDYWVGDDGESPPICCLEGESFVK